VTESIESVRPVRRSSHFPGGAHGAAPIGACVTDALGEAEARERTHAQDPVDLDRPDGRQAVRTQESPGRVHERGVENEPRRALSELGEINHQPDVGLRWLTMHCASRP